MLSQGPNLGLLVHGNQGEEHYDELMAAWRGFDCLIQAHALSRKLAAPPAGPTDGDTYVVAVGATGVWSGEVNQITRWSANLNAWEFFTPKEGWECYVVDEAARVRFNGTDWVVVESVMASALTLSFRASKAHRVWQGACWWRNRFVATTDRDEAFALSNTLSIYDLAGRLLSELTNAYAGTDPQGKKMSFGSPYVRGNYLYVTAYNVNDGGVPLISRVVRFVLNPANDTVALDVTFGNAGAVDLGSGTAEQVARVNGEWWVCYYDQAYVRRFNDAWVTQGTVALSQAFPSDGGPQSMVWEDGDSVGYFVMHGPNSPGLPRSNDIHQYSRVGNVLTYVQTLQTPGYGLTQGAAAGPLGYCWADRPGNRIWVTPALVETPMRAHPPRPGQVDVFTPILENGWVAFDINRTARAYFDPHSGRVHLEGMIKSGNVSLGTRLFSLPAYMAPPHSRNFAVVSNDLFGSVSAIGVSSATLTPGDVIIRAGSATWLALDGVSWLVRD